MPLNVAAYEGIFAHPLFRIKNLAVDINTRAPEAREAFSRAVLKEEHVVSNSLVDTLAGRETTLHLNDLKSSPPDITALEESIIELEIARMKNMAQGPENEKNLEERYDDLEKLSGLRKPLLKHFLSDILKNIDLAPTVEPPKTVEIAEIFDSQIQLRITSLGTVEMRKGEKPDVFVGYFSDENIYMTRELRNRDFPPRSRVSKEVAEFLTALHESEHAVLSEKNSPLIHLLYKNHAYLIGEIDCDLAVIRFLDENGHAPAREQWLQERHIGSFLDGIQNDYKHDTATFIRVLRNTGQQIDLENFIKEKKILMESIREKLGLPRGAVEAAPITDRLEEKNLLPAFSTLMGAIEDILKDDRISLTPLQKAEAESFLEDAKELGYKSNPDYKKVMAETLAMIEKPAAPATAPLPTPVPLR